MLYLIITPPYSRMMPTLGLTAVIKRGERQYIALCPELDIVSQGKTIEKALGNLKEAAELYLDEMDPPEGIGNGEMLVTHFEVDSDAITAGSIGP